jgi:hypothetical protein
MIDRTHIVYENTYLTFFAVMGDKFNAALPGVQYLPRGIRADSCFYSALVWT